MAGVYLLTKHTERVSRKDRGALERKLSLCSQGCSPLRALLCDSTDMRMYKNCNHQKNSPSNAVFRPASAKAEANQHCKQTDAREQCDTLSGPSHKLNPTAARHAARLKHSWALGRALPVVADGVLLLHFDRQSKSPESNQRGLPAAPQSRHAGGSPGSAFMTLKSHTYPEHPAGL